jgi:hypothetical protein
MVYCAIQKKAGLVIVTRDSDYGVTIGNESYINDHLRQEFSERVSRKRSLRLYARLSDALKLFNVRVTEQGEASESELVSRNPVLANRLSAAQQTYLGAVGGIGALNNTFMDLSTLLNLRNILAHSRPAADQTLDSPKVEPAADE